MHSRQPPRALPYLAFAGATGRPPGHDVECVDQEALYGPGSTAYRKVFVSDYWHDVVAARAYNQTPEFAADRKRRPRVERFVAERVRYCGARRARRRGLPAADFQVKGAAMALNLKRWVRLRRSRASAAQNGVEASVG